MSILRSLVLWMTTDCNLRCRYCYARGGDIPEYMSWDVARRAVDLAARSGEPFKIQFSGGEPLLHLELIETVVNYCTNLPVRFQIQTNATLVTQELAIHLLDLGVEMDLVDKRGSYYSFGDTRLGQGRENAKSFLRDDRELAFTLENEIRQTAGLPPRAATEEVVTTEPAA